MKEEKRKCWSCVKYEAFYTKGYCHFDKKDVGFCQQHKKVVNKNECCEHWGYNVMSPKVFRKHAISEQLTQIITKLNVIEQAIKDDINMNEL